MSDTRIAATGARVSDIAKVDSLVTSSVSRVEEVQAAIDIQRVSAGGSVVDFGVDAGPLVSSRTAGFEGPVGTIQAPAPELGLGGGSYDLGISSPRLTLDAPTITSSAGTSGTIRAFAAEGRTLEFAGGPQNFTADLSHVTGRTALARNKAIGAIIGEDFGSLRLTHTPEYSPFIRTGVAKLGDGTQIGKTRFSSRAELRNTIVHEELHHRWWARGIYDHHPVGSALETKFYNTIERYERMRGWTQ
jgi:hypothetical protein